MNEMSLSDIAAVTRGNADEMGGFGSWWIVLVILLMWGRGGWGGNGGGNPVTEADLCSANSFNELKSQIGRMSDQQAAIARQTDNAICNLGYENASLHSQLQAQLANCCCETQRAIDAVNYNIAAQGCETREAIRTEAAATRSLMQENKIEQLQHQITQLETANLINQATYGLIRMPQAFTYTVPFPNLCNCTQTPTTPTTTG